MHLCWVDMQRATSASLTETPCHNQPIKGGYENGITWNNYEYLQAYRLGKSAQTKVSVMFLGQTSLLVDN